MTTPQPSHNLEVLLLKRVREVELPAKIAAGLIVQSCRENWEANKLAEIEQTRLKASQAELNRLNMFPANTQNQTANSAFMNTEHLTQSPVRNTALRVKVTDFKHLLRGKNNCWCAFPSEMAALVNHIGRVVLRGTKKEMGTSNTPGVIATGAVVANEQTFRNRTAGKFPGKPVSGDFTTGLIYVKRAVTFMVCAARVQPATFGLINFFPETFFGGRFRMGRSIVMGANYRTKFAAAYLDSINESLKQFTALQARFFNCSFDLGNGRMCHVIPSFQGVTTPRRLQPARGFFVSSEFNYSIVMG